MAYATSAEYAAYTGQTAPDGIDLLLTRASRLVDQALVCTVYDVDENDLPTDPDHVAAFRDATIEQVSAWVGGGEDGTGAADAYSSVSIGSVTLTRGQDGKRTATSAARQLCPQAAMVLQQAGLTGFGPWTYP